MLDKKKVIVFLFIVLSSQVLAVGIGKYDNANTILFYPNAEKTYSFYLFDGSNIICSIDSELSEYVTIIDPNPGGGPRNVDIKFKFPEYLDPGYHLIYIVATQGSVNGAGSIGGIASVRVPINVFALYPGKHPEINSMGVSDTNFGESANVILQFRNNGEETIDSINSEVSIYDENNNFITTITTNSRSVKSFEDATVNGILDTSKYTMPVGLYLARAKIFYDGVEMDKTANGTFIIGKLDVNVIDTTKEVIVDATNKYYITIESDWSGTIENIYAKITLPNGKIVKTPNIDIVKSEQGVKAKGIIEAYIETDGIAVGSYDVPVTLYYKGQTSEKIVKLNIIDGIAPEIEKPSLFNSTNIAIIVGIVLILIIGIYFFMRKGGSGKSSSSSSDIRPPSL